MVILGSILATIIMIMVILIGIGLGYIDDILYKRKDKIKNIIKLIISAIAVLSFAAAIINMWG